MESINKFVETDPNPIHKVLTIAEQIVQALDDSTIFQRYSNIKQKILDEYAKVSTPQLRQLIIENKDLSERINQIDLQNSRENCLNAYIISQIQILQAKIIPGAPPITSDLVQDATDSLMEVVDTRMMSHQFLKQKLTSENEQLKKSIQEMRNNSVNEIDKIKKKRIDMFSNWQNTEIELKKKLNEIEASIIEYKAKMPTDTDSLKQQLNSIVLDPTRVDAAESQLNRVEAQRDKLRMQVKRLQFALQKIEFELDGLKKAQEEISNQS